jgi:predicted RNase H-like nuclease (RuvC/YqgF family)
MENPTNRIAEQQRRTLDFMLGSLGLRHAHDAVVRRDRIAELETTVIALGAENLVLRREVQELERQLCPLEAEIDAFEREMDGRLALVRERAAENAI